VLGMYEDASEKRRVLLNGQHRIKALELYTRNKADNTLVWPCIIYGSDLPKDCRQYLEISAGEVITKSTSFKQVVEMIQDMPTKLFSSVTHGLKGSYQPVMFMPFKAFPENLNGLGVLGVCDTKNITMDKKHRCQRPNFNEDFEKEFVGTREDKQKMHDTFINFCNDCLEELSNTQEVKGFNLSGLNKIACVYCKKQLVNEILRFEMC
jgi:hypothetical protein